MAASAVRRDARTVWEFSMRRRIRFQPHQDQAILALAIRGISHNVTPSFAL